MRYIKNYQNDLVRKGETFKDYRFSDEREWRYVPDIESKFPFILPADEFENEKQKEEANALLQNVILDFNPDDIKYIIIDSDAEISEFVFELKASKGKTYTHDQVERLMTRIITTSQIKTDF